jgi:hypothetical protein
VQLDIIKVLYSPTDAQVNCLKNNIKIYIKKSSDMFRALTSTNNALPEDGVTAPKHVGAVFNVNFNIVFKTVDLFISW